MKKIIQLSLIVFSVFFLSACTLNKSSQNSSTDQPSDSGQETQQANKKMSLKDLIKVGVAQKCTWDYQENGESMSGEVYVKGGKFKQTAIITNEEGTHKLNYIGDGQDLYFWTDGANSFAFKTKLDQEDQQVDPSDPSTFDWSNEYEFKCNPTVLSDADFALPSGIEFMSMDDFANDLQESFQMTE